jgi:hypothetical protein
MSRTLATAPLTEPPSDDRTPEELDELCDQIVAECDCPVPVMIGPDNKEEVIVVTRKFGAWPPLVHVFCHRRRSSRATRTANRGWLIAEIKSRDKDVRVFDRDADLMRNTLRM